MTRIRINPVFQQKSAMKTKLLTNRLSVAERGLIGMHPTEEQEQISVIKACRDLPYKGETIADYIHHSPNGGKRTMREGREFKQAGTKAGFPDLILPIARQGYHGLYIEMKSLTGVVTSIQHEYHEKLREENYRVEVCKGAKAAIHVILDYLYKNK